MSVLGLPTSAQVIFVDADGSDRINVPFYRDELITSIFLMIRGVYGRVLLRKIYGLISKL